MKIVLVEPITKRPTILEPQYGQPMYFEGPYQNCAIVSEEYVNAEMRRLRAVQFLSQESNPLDPMR